jgi:uncharacterized protein involved in response to NO
MIPSHWLTAGFRPFFLLGALAMAASVLVWIPVHVGGLEIPTVFAPRDWHVHTMLFGGVLAIVAGFALTAVSNWTGRPPVAGRELLFLAGLWVIGRAAVSTSAVIGPTVALVADLLFPMALTAVFAREVIAGRQYRNLVVVAVVAALGLANLAFHLEASAFGATDYALRGSIALVLTLVMLIGGRIVPAFTRNWLASRKHRRLPAAFSRFDGAVMAVSITALAAWTAFPFASGTAALLSAAGVLGAIRLSRWRGLATRAEPLLMILHVAFGTIPLGFLLVAGSIVAPGVIDPVAAVHVWTVGTFGSITLAVMTRASRGHSGQALTAGRLEVAMFALVLVGAAARVAAPYAGGWSLHALDGAGLAFAAAYLLFAAGYGPMLLRTPTAG